MQFHSIDPYDFLSPERDDDERKTQERRLFTYSIEAIKDANKIERLFINHPAAKQGLEAMDRVYQLGRALGLQQGMLLVGPPGSGKSTLLQYFRESLPSDDLIEPGCQAIALRLQKHPVVRRVISSMLRQIRYPLPDTRENNVSIKKDILIEALKQKGTRVLLVDEAHHLCSTGRRASNEGVGNDLTDFLCELMDAASIAIVLAGAPALDQLSNVDRHLLSRITVRVQLEEYGNSPLWAGIVGAIARQQSLIDMTMLLNAAELSKLHGATRGNLRLLKRFLTEVTMVAVDAKQPGIDLPSMALAFDRIRGPHCQQPNPYRS